MRDVLVLVLGGGRGSRLFPLTHLRSKPAVPIGGKYRLIDVPISNCLHVGLRRIFVLTQFNSASLNRHIAQAYRLDAFSDGFVEILAAEQTPDNSNWFQGTADAVRRAMRHFAELEARHYLILAGDHLYRMDFARLIGTHVDSGADITIAAQPVAPNEATQMGIFRFDADGRIVAFEEKPSLERLHVIGTSVPADSRAIPHDPGRPFVASLGIYVFSRDVLFDVLQRTTFDDFGRQVIPAALARHRVRPYLFDGYWADVGTIASFYEANMALIQPHPPFSFYDPARPIFTRPRFLPASHISGATIRNALVAEGCTLEDCSIEDSIVGIRSRIGRGARVSRSVLLGADYYEDEHRAHAAAERPPLGIGRDVVLDRVIVDKNARVGDGARLVNARHLEEGEGPGYFIRNGIIIVPKGATVANGTVV